MTEKESTVGRRERGQGAAYEISGPIAPHPISTLRSKGEHEHRVGVRANMQL